MSDYERFSILENRILILQKDLGGTQQEISQVLQEMQGTIVSLYKGLQVAVETINARLAVLEEKPTEQPDTADVPKSEHVEL